LATDREHDSAQLQRVGEGRGCEVTLDELLADGSALRELVGDVTGRKVADSERASDALESWLSARTGRAYVLDHDDAVSVGRACLCAALGCERRDDYVKAALVLPAEQQARLYGLVEENELWQLRALLTRREREAAALREQLRTLELGSARLADAQVDAARRLEAVECAAAAAAGKAAARLAVAEARASRAEDELRSLADELDVARGKAAQLVKAEAKLARLMQRLDETAALRSRLDGAHDSAGELERKLSEAGELEALRAELGEARRRAAEAEATAAEAEVAAARARAALSERPQRCRSGSEQGRDEVPVPSWWEAILQGCGAARRGSQD
jgi:DNA repair exonuclease SbcCD ATPase subunit